MYINDILIPYMIFGIYCDLCVGQLSCFKKFRRKKNTCGGIIKRHALTTPDECCESRGQGFTQQTAVILSRNQYECTSCKAWKSQTSGQTALKPLNDQFVCYRKHRPKKGECGGRIKRARVTNVKACCEGTGSGFSTSGLSQLGRNRYTCISCESWEKNQTIPTIPPITTTESPSEWGHWSQCSRTCGSGVRERYRKCTTCDLDDPGNKEIKHCTVHFYCPEPGEWGSWAEWEECSQPCGGGIRRRQRLCDSPEPRHGGADCKGPSEETGLCNEQECIVDGGWMPWTRFGHCSHTCGRGEMLRTRMCTNPAPRGGGQQCVGRSIDARRCEDRKCPVHGGWSDWDPWSSCDSTCGTGKRVRSRACNRPRPDFGGKHCEGSEEEVGTCEHAQPCPVQGGWSQWSYYGPCRAAPCQHGHRLRTRECDSPRPSHGGRMCRGDSVERNPCFNDEGCAVDGGWCDFGLWTQCSTTCLGETGSQTRARACYCPPTQGSGKRCEGESREMRTCEGYRPCRDTPDVDLGN